MAFFSKVWDIIKEAPRTIVTVIPANVVINGVIDYTKRQIYEITGQMNYDIIKDGILLSSVKDLEAGDILLKQGGYRELGDLTSYVIMGGQSILNSSGHRYQQAGLLGHAAIYVGDRSCVLRNDVKTHNGTIQKGTKITGDLVESVGDGVRLDSIASEHNNQYSWYVIRCNDSDMAKKICKYAMETVGYIEYEKFAALWSGISSDVGINAYLDFRDDETDRIAKLLDNHHQEKKEGYAARMFCSELVAFCLNRACKEAKIDRYFGKRRQDYITPEDVYVTLRDSDKWTYKGELKKYVR